MIIISQSRISEKWEYLYIEMILINNSRQYILYFK